MNRIYRTLWSVATQSWQAVPETAKSAGKKSKSSAGGVLASVALGLSLVSGANAQAPPAVNQLPTGGSVARGVATISQTATAQAAAMTVNQSSQRAVVNWNTFNVGSNASVNFVQPNAQAVTLNRVNDSNPSQIFGRISANGQVFLTNANGVYFSPSSSVDVGALTATTHSITDDNFMSGNYVFERNGATGKIINEGNITAALGGYVALLAPEVQNAGVVVARAGTVAMAAGELITLNVDGAGSLAGITTTPSAIASLVENKLAVLAPDGQIILSAVALDKLQAGMVKNSGSLEANSLVNKGGKIVLEADQIAMDRNSKIEAKGATGGGVVLVGGDWQGSGTLRQAIKVTMEAGATIDASATDNGDGGKVVLWSDVHNADSVTQVNGNIKAEAGPNGGNGGKVETSGHTLKVGDAININTGGGQWLLDPYDFTIAASGDISGTSLGGLLGTNNITIAASSTSSASNTATTKYGASGTSGNIYINDSVSWSSTNVLTLQADGGVSGAGNLSMTASALGSGVVFNQGADSTYSGNITGSAQTSTVTKSGNGTLTLSGNSTNLRVTVSVGTLKVGSINGIGTSLGVTVNSGATLDLNSFSVPSSNRQLYISGTGVSGQGVLINSGLSNATWAGQIYLTGNSLINSMAGGITIGSSLNTSPTGSNFNLTLDGTANFSSFTYNGITLNGGSLTKNGSGTWSFAGTSTYTGGTTVNQGILTSPFNSNGVNKFGTGNITINGGGSLQLSGDQSADTVTIGAGGGSIISTRTTGYTLTANSYVINSDSTAMIQVILADRITTSPAPAVHATLSKSGTGTLELDLVNTYTGATSITGGTLQLGGGAASSSGSIAAASVITLGSGGTLAFNVPPDASGNITPTNVISSSVTGAGTISNLYSVSSSKLVLTAAGVLTAHSGGQANYSGGYSAFYDEKNNILGSIVLGNVLGASPDFTGLTFNVNTAGYKSTFPTQQAITWTGTATGSAPSLTLNGSTQLCTGATCLGAKLTFNASGNLSIDPGAAWKLTNNGTEYYLTDASTSPYTLVGSATAELFYGASVTQSGKLDGTGSLTVSGVGGTLKLSGANTYSGGTNISSGTLQAGNVTAFGANAIVESSGAVVDLNGITMTSTGGLTLNGTGISKGGALINSSSTASGFAGLVTLAANTTLGGGTGTIGLSNASAIVGGGNELTLSGSGSITAGLNTSISSLTKVGTGNWTLNGTSTYTGAININGGKLALGSSGAIGSSGTINFGGGTLQFSASNTADYSNRFSTAANQQYSFDTNSQNVTFASAFTSVGGTLTKSGAGVLTLSGDNTYNVTTTVSAGTLRAGSATAFGSSAISVTSGAVLDLYGQTINSANAGKLTLNGTGISSGGALINSSTTAATYGGVVALGTASSIVGGSGSIALTNAANLAGYTYGLTLGGAIGGSIASPIAITTGILTKEGAGTWTLSGLNYSTGAVNITAGALRAANDQALGTVTGGAVTVSNGATLEIGGLTVAGVTTNIHIGAKAVTVADGGTIHNVAGDNTYAGNMTLSGNATITIDTGTSLNFQATTPDLTVSAGKRLTLNTNGNLTFGQNLIGGDANSLYTKTGSGTLLMGTGSTLGTVINVYAGLYDPTGTDYSSQYGVAADYTVAFYTAASGGTKVSMVAGTDYSGTAVWTGTTPTLTSAAGTVSSLTYASGITISNTRYMYAGPTSATTWTVVPRPVTVTLTAPGSTYTYNGTTTYASIASGLTAFTYTTMAAGNSITSLNYAVSSTGVAQAGSFNITPSMNIMVGTAANYSFTFTPLTVAVAKANLAITATASLTGNVYNGTAYTGTYTTTALGSDASGITVTGLATGTNAGTYHSSLAASGSVLSNYNTPTITNNDLVISPKPITITNNAVSATYDATSTYAALVATAGYTPTALVGSDRIGSVTQTLTAVNASDIAQAGTFTSTPSAAVLSVGNPINYSFTYAGPTTNTVAKANLTISATASSGNVYNGTAYTGTYTTTALGNDASGITVTGLATGTNQGTYASSLAFTASGNVLSNYNTPTITNANLVISPRPVTLTGQMNYSGQPTLDTTQTGTTLSASNVVSGDSLSITGTATLASADAGTRAITAFNSLSLSNSNYTTTGASGSVSVISTSNINVAPLSNTEVLALIGSQLAGLTGSQMASFSNAQLTVFSWQQIASLSPSQFAALTPAQLASLNPAQLFGLTAAQLSSMSSTQLGGLTASQLAGLSTAQLQGLTAAQVRALSVTQISQLTPEQIAYLVGNGAMSFTLQQLMALSPAQLAGLSAAQVGRFTAEQLSSLSYAQLQALSLGQLAAISPAALGALSAEQIMALSLTQVASLTPDQLTGLSPTQIASLSAAEIASFDELQLAAIGIFPKVDTPVTPVEAVAAAPTKPEETAKFEAPIPVMIEVATPSAPAVEVAAPAPAVASTAVAQPSVSTAQATPVTAPVDTEVRAGVLPVTLLSSANARPTTTGVAFEQDDNGVSLHVTAAPPTPPVSAKLVFNDKLTTFMVAQDNGKMVEFQGGLINKRLVIVAPSAAAKQIARSEMNMVLAAAITSLGAENRVVLANLSGVVIDLR